MGNTCGMIEVLCHTHVTGNVCPTWLKGEWFLLGNSLPFHLLKKFLEFNRIWTFITMFRNTWQRLWRESKESNYDLTTFFKIFPSTLRSPKWCLPLDFLTKILYVFLIWCILAAWFSRLMLFDSIALIRNILRRVASMCGSPLCLLRLCPIPISRV